MQASRCLETFRDNDARSFIASVLLSIFQQSAIALAKWFQESFICRDSVGILRLHQQASAKFADVHDAYENSFTEKRQLSHGPGILIYIKRLD